MKPYANVSISLSFAEDEDILQALETVPKGSVSAWIKQAIRQRIESEKKANQKKA